MSQARAPITAWRELSMALPDHHAALTRGETDAFLSALARLPRVEPEALAALDEREAMLAGLDVLMVEAAVRRHGLPREGTQLDLCAQAVADRLGLLPIISYPLYIRENPADLAETRRFTHYASEYRFIRMHAAIEDRFDDLIARMEAIVRAPDPRRSFREDFAALAEGLRTTNRIMSGFRSPVRMPNADFYEGFRPYYDARYDADSGALVLDGPSGLQSYTYRIVAMLLGYRDRVLDDWTERIGRYHRPEVRERLASVMAARDAGLNLNRVICDAILGPSDDLPHQHPAYARHLAPMLALAERSGFLAADVLGVLEHYGLELGHWPGAAPEQAEPPAFEAPADLDATDRADLMRLVQLEAGLMGMHLEHVATAAIQIGADRGTGGTSGVEFLLMATFRRAFPGLWHSGLGAALAAEA